MHDCPVLRNLAINVPSMASLKFASSNTSTGACPPNSKESGLTCFAAPSINFFPTLTRPEKGSFSADEITKNYLTDSRSGPGNELNHGGGHPRGIDPRGNPRATHRRAASRLKIHRPSGCQGWALFSNRQHEW